VKGGSGWQEEAVQRKRIKWKKFSNLLIARVRGCMRGRGQVKEA